MAFVRLPVDREGLHVVPLYDETVVLAMHEEHLLTLGKTVTLVDFTGEKLLDGEPDEAMFRLIAEGGGVAVMPASVAKSLRRRDVVALPVRDAEPSTVALAWSAETSNPLTDDFLGIVRGRSAHSSRSPGVQEAESAAADRARTARRSEATERARAAKKERAAKRDRALRQPRAPQKKGRRR